MSEGAAVFGRAAEASSELAAAPGAESGLRVTGISKRLGGNAILRGVDLHVGPGEILGLVGPNGAGKTTLLQIMVGEWRADSGEMSLAGRRCPPRWGLARRARLGLGYLPQHSSVFQRLSVWENLRAVPGPSADACMEMLVRAGLRAHQHAWAGQLSGGERRRLELARLLLMKPQVLLCDEPFAGLDPVGVDAFVDLLREAADAGRAVLITDHRVEVLITACDTLAVLLDGSIRRHARARELEGDSELRVRYFGRTLDGRS